MGKTQAGPCLRERRIRFGRVRENGNRRVEMPQVKEGDPQIAEHRRAARRECLALLESEASRKGMTLRPELPGEPLWVYGDNGKLKQALLNLAVNGFDAMPLGGTLTIRAAQHEDECVVEIEDTGQGIKDDEKAKIFRFHYSTKDSGSGIGLSIVKMVTEYHGGRVEFDSTEGKGSRFTLRFPKGRKDGPENHHHR